MGYDGFMDERDFFTERPEQKTAQYSCPRCKRRNEYMVRWMRRTKKDRLPPGADARDRALHAKLRDYLIRMDDDVTCKACGKRFEIPSHQSMVFLDETAAKGGAQNDDPDDDNRGNRA
jgi:DNA-directed RNA polymerase subunit RPC12/RpoP